MKDRIIWRPYTDEDLDAVVSLHLETEAALDRPMQLPDLMDRPVLETWVAERDGKVVGFFYLEAQIEIVFGGRNPEVSASARRFAPTILDSLRRRGLRIARLFVPKWIGPEADSIGKELMRTGFVRLNGDFDDYRFDLSER